MWDAGFDAVLSATQPHMPTILTRTSSPATKYHDMATRCLRAGNMMQQEVNLLSSYKHINKKGVLVKVSMSE